MTIPNALSSSSKKPQSGPAAISTLSQPPEAGRSKSGPATGRRVSACGACCGFLAGLILVGFLGTALVVYKNHGAFSLGWFRGYHEGDQILANRMDSRFSSVLCETYTVQAWSDSVKGASFYLTDGPAKLNPDYRQVVTVNSNGVRSYQDFTYAAFYLLPGSVIETTACTQLHTIDGEILFIKGSNLFDQWKQSSICDECVAQRVRIPEGLDCEVVLSDMPARFAVEKADTYYVVITRRYRWQDDVVFTADVTMTVTKTVYDLSQAKAKCLETGSCTFNLTYDADDDIIVQFPFEEFATEDPHNSFGTTCGIRMKFYLIVFLLVPGCLIFLLILLSCICCVHSDRNSRHPLQHKKAEVKAAFVTTDPLGQRETLPPI